MTTIQLSDAQRDSCDDCGGPVPVWFADNVIWNEVMGGPGTTDDPGGYLCVHCFIVRAETVLAPTAWRLTPEWPWRRRVNDPSD